MSIEGSKNHSGTNRPVNRLRRASGRSGIVFSLVRLTITDLPSLIYIIKANPLARVLHNDEPEYSKRGLIDF